MKQSSYDVIIVGGGPAGLSAALILGRSRRRVLLCDAGKPRNRWSHAMHGYLSRDGIDPKKFLEITRKQLRPYGIEIQHGVVRSACPGRRGFTVVLENGSRRHSRKLLVATGMTDRLPPIGNILDFYGRSVFHCPYCDGWERRDQPLAVYGQGKNGAGLAVSLQTWSSDVVLCTNGSRRMSAEDRDRLKRRNIPVRHERIASLEGRGGVLKRILFERGDPLPRRALFFSTGQDQSCDLARTLGCILNGKGTINTDRLSGTNVPGLYVAGDASRDVQLVIVAAAEGAKAGCAINQALQKEDEQEA